MDDNGVRQAPGESVKNAHSGPQRLKIILAVHGIGDQFKFATIQSVANRFCLSRENPRSLPLGKFYDESIGETPETYLLRLDVNEGKPPDKYSKLEYGFSEIYWADIPRVPETEGYTIEEAKKWARTVVDRLRGSHLPNPNEKAPNDLSATDIRMAKDLLDEMIETIAVLERLAFIAKKAGVFEFNLKNILVKYLGDVQLVTDFKRYRDEILDRFFTVANRVSLFNGGNTDIYIVAHSEGTVVTLLALLEALSEKVAGNDGQKSKQRCSWVKQVKGLMTIGSPIDKHLVLWRDLWTNFEGPPIVNLPDQKIQWRNYYDFGDPIGFELDVARAWLCKYNYDAAFDFPASHDHGFGRYPFPGKAHNDYWTDSDVFNHFIQTVVEEDSHKAGEPGEMCPDKNGHLDHDRASKRGTKPDASPAEPASSPAPRSKHGWRVFSNIFPYCLVVSLIFFGVYLLYKAVNEYERVDDYAFSVLRNVGGISIVLIGLTLLAQIPRLTRHWRWRFAAFAIFSLSLVGYWHIPDCRTHLRLGCFIASWFIPRPDEDQARTSVILLAIVMAIAVYLVGRKRPRAGLRVLLSLGVVALTLTIGVGLFGKTGASSAVTDAETILCKCDPNISAAVQSAQVKASADDAKKPLWPLLLATAALLYLWWLSALIFDLVVVWHHYIRYSGARKRFSERAKARLKSSPVRIETETSA
jgi:hypothetical protein